MFVLNPLLPPFFLCSYVQSVLPAAECRALAAHQKGLGTAKRLLHLLDFASRGKGHGEGGEIISVPELQYCLQILEVYQSEQPAIEKNSS